MSNRKPMTPEKRAYLSALGKAMYAAIPRDRACAKCGEPIIDRYTFCKTCWEGFPDRTREMVRAAAKPGTWWGHQTSEVYAAAVEKALR